ncbi:MAG: ChaN family lipoprotein [Putridiphycobacter sp.]|nr:ChaN family lipoprotein [Putridiphycobacter sp.]
MKTLSLLLAFTFSITTFANAHLKSYQLYTKEGKKTSFDKMVKTLSETHYIFFGEEHNNTIAHWLQLELTQELYMIHKRKLVLGGEMFEADNQYILNEYLSAYISPRNFQNEMRLWSNYNTDYKPLIELAKTENIPFIATNIPRRYANMTYKKGIESLEKLSDLAKSFIVPLNTFAFDSTVACYKNMITMEHGGINMATAQAIKDATMAHFIYKNSNPTTHFLHFNGSYHSNNREGIIYYLKQKVADNLIGTITTVTQSNLSELEKDNLGLADFIICVKSTVTTTH